MIKIPYKDIIAKIESKANISKEEIESKIKAKTKQLSGLISKEGAAHIVANELGVKIFEDFSGKLQIKNILPGMRDVETVAKVTAVYELREFETNGRKGKVASMMVGDETGTIRITMWGNQADNINSIKQGDIIKILSGYVRENRGYKEIHLNDKSKILINPKGETVGEVKLTSQPQGNAKRKQIKDLLETDNNIELFGTIVQAFEPRFYEVCPNCSKRARPEGNTFNCPQHGSVNPDYSYVFNVVLDDGSETIRAVFFREQVEKLLSMKKEELMKFKEEPEQFTEIKDNLLGTMISITGRPNKNEMFDRLEFISRDVNPKPNPQDEIDRLEKAKNEV